MKAAFFTITLALALGSPEVRAGFLYHDRATTTGGEFSGNFPIGNLRNAGHGSHLEPENGADSSESYATSNPATGGFPVTVTLEFDNTVELTRFYLWNHSNNNGGGAPANGVNDFTLTFYDGTSGGGSPVGAVFSGSASAAPATGTYSAEVFDLGATYANVRSAEFRIINKQGDNTSGFVALRELGFEGTAVAPEPFLYHNSATTNGGEFNSSFAVENLRNGGYGSPATTENANLPAADLSYATKNPPTGGYPVTLTLDFDGLANLEAFHLWNHSNSGSSGAPDQGIKDFTLIFHDGLGGSGNVIGTTFSGSAAKAPSTGPYPAETFNFGTTYTGVRSVVFTADNHNAGSDFVGIREIAFRGAMTPLPPQPTATPDKVIVYLVGGQSNADGYGVTGELDPNLQAPQPEIDFYHGNAGGSSPLTANEWIRLQPGSGSKPGNAGGFGPELNFGIDIHEVLGSGGARIAVIKHALGGSSLHTAWLPGGDDTTAGDGPAYQAFQSTVADGLAALGLLYPDASIQLEGMVWHQGEGDTGSDSNAAAYEARLTNFIADLRATYFAGLKFGIVQLSDNQTSLNANRRATVKAAQAAVAAADPANYLVATDDLPMGGGSSIHFGTDGVLTIGSRLAAGMRRVPINDLDGNGLDDDWEEVYWGVGNTGQDPDGDDDQDLLTNLEEFLWLTDPRVPSLVTARLTASPTPAITWPSSPDRRYLIEVSPDLTTWKRIDSFIPGSGGTTTTYEVPDSPGGPDHFLRIGLQR